MELSQYLLAWAGYLIGALGCLLVWCRMTRNLSSVGLRRWLQASAAAVLFTPWLVADNLTELAPALMIALFDALLQGPDAALRAGVPLLGVLGVAWGMTGLYHGGWLLVRGQKNRSAQNSSVPERMEPTADV